MGPPTTNKDLLKMEQKSPISSLESTLLVCKNETLSQTQKPHTCSGKLETGSVPKSQVLGKVKDFLAVMAESNTRLQRDEKENPNIDYDIEVLTGNETECIEMDLVLGVADLHTPEAVAAAESAMAGYELVIPLATTSSDSDTESSDDEEDDDDINNGNTSDKACSPNKLKKSTQEEVDLKNGQPKKRQKIIELL